MNKVTSKNLVCSELVQIQGKKTELTLVNKYFSTK